jgi:hypothetical protein
MLGPYRTIATIFARAEELFREIGCSVDPASAVMLLY